MEDFGEKILEVRYRKATFLPILFCLSLGALVVLAVYYQWDRPDVSVFDVFLGLGLGFIIIGNGLWMIFRDETKSVIIVYENGIWSKFFRLTPQNFLYWSYVSQLYSKSYVGCSYILFIIENNEDGNKNVQCAGFVKQRAMESSLSLFSGSPIVMFDISSADIRSVCNSALNEYRKKNALA